MNIGFKQLNIIYASFLCVVLLSSCNNFKEEVKFDEGAIVDNVYKSEALGWSIEIPQDWDLISLNEQIETNELGQDAIEDYIDGEIEMSGLKNLVSFKKDDFNSFQSSSESYDLDYEGEYEDINTMLKELIYETFRSQGMKTDTTATTTVNVDGLDFYTYSITLYGPDDVEILKQEMFSRYINGQDFGVNINYNNQESGKVLRDAFLNSMFE